MVTPYVSQEFPSGVCEGTSTAGERIAAICGPGYEIPPDALALIAPRGGKPAPLCAGRQDSSNGLL